MSYLDDGLSFLTDSVLEPEPSSRARKAKSGGNFQGGEGGEGSAVAMGIALGILAAAIIIFFMMGGGASSMGGGGGEEAEEDAHMTAKQLQREIDELAAQNVVQSVQIGAVQGEIDALQQQQQPPAPAPAPAPASGSSSGGSALHQRARLAAGARGNRQGVSFGSLPPRSGGAGSMLAQVGNTRLNQGAVNVTAAAKSRLGQSPAAARPQSPVKVPSPTAASVLPSAQEVQEHKEAAKSKVNVAAAQARRRTKAAAMKEGCESCGQHTKASANARITGKDDWTDYETWNVDPKTERMWGGGTKPYAEDDSDGQFRSLRQMMEDAEVVGMNLSHEGEESFMYTYMPNFTNANNSLGMPLSAVAQAAEGDFERFRLRATRYGPTVPSSGHDTVGEDAVSDQLDAIEASDGAGLM